MLNTGATPDEKVSRILAPAVVGSQAALMSIISAITIVVFNLLRTKYKMIYAPKVKYHTGDKSPPRISDSHLGWLPPLYRTKEPELLMKIDLDATTFLRFCRMMRVLFCCIAFLGCAVLIPIDAVYTIKNGLDMDILSMLTISDVAGPLLFAHIAASYVITCLVMFFIWRNWKHMLRLRQEWFRSPEYLESLYARTLIVTNVPKNDRTDAGVREILENVHAPYTATSVHIGHKVERLPVLVEEHNTVVRGFEQALVTYLKDGQITKKRPTIRIGGFLGMGGEKKDAIDFYTAKLRETEKAVEDCRQKIDTYQAEKYGFASMAAVPYAHVVARTLRKKHPNGTSIALAPNPKDIIWRNLNKSNARLCFRRSIGFVLLVLVCFFYTIPLFVISLLANLSSISSSSSFLTKWAKASPGSLAIVSGVLPPAIPAVFGLLFPIIIRWITEFQGVQTRSRRNCIVVSRYFAFLVISQLVIFSLIGYYFFVIEFDETILSPTSPPPSSSEWAAAFGVAYVEQASYWLTFFPLCGFLIIFELARIPNLIWTSFKTRVFGRTPRDIREWTQPPEFPYDVHYSNLLFLGTVGLVFAPLAPLVSLAAAIVFWMSSWVYKYQLMYVFVTPVETGGRLWNMVVNRLLASVVMMQIVMIFTIAYIDQWMGYAWVTAVPPILIVAIFKVFLDRTFYDKFRYYLPSEVELREANIHASDGDDAQNRLKKRFGHPMLHAGLFTPMLHAGMMPLLKDVYKDRIESHEVQLDEYGGRTMDAYVVGGDIRIAGIKEDDLEYDPELYQRDRGELYSDVPSDASTAFLDRNEPSSVARELSQATEPLMNEVRLTAVED